MIHFKKILIKHTKNNNIIICGDKKKNNIYRIFLIDNI